MIISTGMANAEEIQEAIDATQGAAVRNWLSCSVSAATRRQRKITTCAPSRT
nr:hypothetical protein [Pistricoccus aurantiacus]